MMFAPAEAGVIADMEAERATALAAGVAAQASEKQATVMQQSVLKKLLEQPETDERNDLVAEVEGMEVMSWVWGSPFFIAGDQSRQQVYNWLETSNYQAEGHAVVAAAHYCDACEAYMEVKENNEYVMSKLTEIFNGLN